MLSNATKRMSIRLSKKWVKSKSFYITLLQIALVGHLAFPLVSSSSCNEFVCGSVVSKCLLTQSCQCKLTDCYCCKDCLNCLGDLYMECCSCLDMCPEHNETLSALMPSSQIGDLEGLPELFDTLTAEESDELWSTIRFPMRIALRSGDDAVDQLAAESEILKNGYQNGQKASKGKKKNKSQAAAAAPPVSVNCTVIYFNTCVSNQKCAQDCESMGSTSYRWFHDGCCECVGAHCYNYGINESRCSACPGAEDEDDVEDEMDLLDADYGGGLSGGLLSSTKDSSLWDYGEDEMNYN